VVETPPKVFISYSHDTLLHADRVLELANKLAEDGIKVILDQYVPSPAQGWHRWMEENIESADYVLLICTEQYLNRVRGIEAPGVGLGVRWEGTLIYARVYESGPVGDRFIPIIFSEQDSKFIPLPLKSHQRYFLSDFGLDHQSYEHLYRHLTQQPFVEAPKFDQPLVKLPPRDALKKSDGLAISVSAERSETGAERMSTRKGKGKGGRLEYLARRKREKTETAIYAEDNYQFDTAIKLFREASQINPSDSVAAWYVLSSLAVARRWLELLAEIEILRSRFPMEDFRLLELTALRGLNRMSVDEALQAGIDKVAANSVDRGEAYSFLVNVLELGTPSLAGVRGLSASSRDLALQFITASLEAVPDDASLYTLRALLTLIEGDLEQGFKLLDENVSRIMQMPASRPHSTIFTGFRLVSVAIVFGMFEAHRRAIEILMMAGNIAPKSGRPDFLIACCYARLRDGTETLRWLQKAIEKSSYYQVHARVVHDFDVLRSEPAFHSLVFGGGASGA